MMKIHSPLNNIENIKNLVFLAGPCPRAGQDWTDWREDMCVELINAGFNGEIVNPTNPNYDVNDPDYYDKQCSWETLGLHMSSVIIFWIDRNGEHPALTTNIEFGIWSDKAPKSLVVGIPEGSEHCGYIKWVCEKKGIKCFNTMKEVAAEVVSRFSNKSRTFFTSDTHFSSDRHIEFSKRPFIDTNDMDLTLISNWNKTVTANDIVFHLGDFGNYEILKKLNFKQMYLILGNYERDDKNFKIDDPRVIVRENMSIKIDDVMVKNLIGDTNITLVHEPVSGKKSDFYLFGHIHEKGKVKRNGFNVGTDCNNFTPVNLDTVKFYMNAILKHYDENVFTEMCK